MVRWIRIYAQTCKSPWILTCTYSTRAGADNTLLYIPLWDYIISWWVACYVVSYTKKPSRGWPSWKWASTWITRVWLAPTGNERVKMLSRIRYRNHHPDLFVVDTMHEIQCLISVDSFKRTTMFDFLVVVFPWASSIWPWLRISRSTGRQLKHTCSRSSMSWFSVTLPRSWPDCAILKSIPSICFDLSGLTSAIRETISRVPIFLSHSQRR